ncbi:MAG: LPXTG cell wall anchor domain-containing protein, partial [Egibacteraceae bacterium]
LGSVKGPEDVTAPPDSARGRNLGAVVSAARAVNPAAVVPAARAVSRPVPARELPRTGSDLTVGALLGALVLLTGGAAVLTVARRRARHNA